MSMGRSNMKKTHTGRMSTDSFMGFAYVLVVVWSWFSVKRVSEKNESRLRWDFNPAPLLFVSNR